MIKLKIKTETYFKENGRSMSNYTLFLATTDGMESILYTDDFSEVMRKVTEIKKVLPSIIDDVEML